LPATSRSADHQRGARSPARRTDAPVGVAVARMVGRDSHRVLHARRPRVSQRHVLNGEQ
jgi:hypothetical protein